MRKYFYNKQTLKYEPLKVPVRVKFLRGFGIFSAILVSAAVLYVISDMYFPSQKEQALMRELDEMKHEYNDLLDEVGLMSDELSRIQDRDAQVHRFMFDMEPIDDAVWSAGVPPIREGCHEDSTRVMKAAPTASLSTPSGGARC